MPQRFILFLGLAAVCACGPAPGDLGSRCSSDRDCTTGACFTGFSGGYCSQRCESSPCPAEARCAALAGGSFCLQECITTLDCRAEYHCADVSAGSVCFPDCSSDSECGAGAVCGPEARCTPGSPGAVGASCVVNAGCASDRCEIAYNGGYCTEPCAQEGPGSFDQGCPSAAVCAKVSEAGGLCHATCRSDSDCRSDYWCDGSGASGACRPRCRGAANCGMGYTCDLAAGGKCVEGSASPRKLGSSCTGDGACDSAYCLDEPNQGFPKGVCSEDCSDNSALCGTQGVCIAPSDPAAASVCLQKCQSNFECRGDYFCASVQGSSDSVCIPRCTAVPMCSAPEVCDEYSGECAPPGAAGSTHIVRVPIGTLPISGSQSQGSFTLDVPSDALSYTVVMKGGVGGISAISRLTSPSGELLFDLDDYLTSKVRILPVNDGDFAMLFPNSPRVPIEAGRYSFTIVNEDGSGTGEVFALLKKSTTARLSGGELNINVWFAGLPVTAATAASDGDMQAVITEMKRLYATAGITLGQVRYFDVPAAQASSFAVIDSTDGSDSELRRLFEVSAGAPNNWMNFFMVKEIKGADYGYTILGIAGGIPGIPFEQGTNASGVAVTALDLADDPESVARTMAHEGGHWLGLWHTSESNGTMFDPLSDTPECPAARDANEDGRISSAECSGYGADYLMFWQAGPTASKLSGNQGYVLVRNPVVSSP